MADLEKTEKFINEYMDFLKEEIAQYCNKNNNYEIYWDYDDEVSAEMIMDAYHICENKTDYYGSVKDKLLEKIMDMNFDYDQYFFDKVYDDVTDSDLYQEDDFEDWFIQRDLVEDLYDCGYGGIEANLEELLDNSLFKINIMFATEKEANYDMGSIVNAYGSWRAPSFDVDSFDNALTYLIYQQGYTVDEYFCGLMRGERKSEKANFMDSVVEECINNGAECMSELVAMVKFNGNELCDFMDCLLGYKEAPKNLKFSKNTAMGIFNEWIGAGGMLGIELEKDLIVPFDMISHFQVEGDSRDGYTVDDVYGLSDIWTDGKMTETDEEPEFPELYMNEELFKDSIVKFQKMYEKQNA